MKTGILKAIFCSVLVLSTSCTCFAQDLVVEVVQGSAATITSLVRRSSLVVDGKVVGNVVTDEVEQGKVEQDVQLLRVQSEASRIVVTADSQDRTPLEAIKLGDEYWVINHNGRAWVTVQAVDFEKNIFEQKRLVVDVQTGEDGKPSGDAPIDKLGLRVLIVVESEDLASMPESQRQILFGMRTRLWLNDNCAKAEDGQPEWRVLDQNTEFPEQCDEVWCKALSRDRSEIPWVVISNGKTGFEGALPNNIDDFLKLVEQYK